MARGEGNAFLLWKTDGLPDKWPVIVTDDQFARWSVFEGQLVDLLGELARVPSDEPVFVSQAQRVREAESVATPTGFPRNVGTPIRKSKELYDLVGESSLSDRVTRPLCRQIPDDYREFVAKYGPGVFADISIHADSGSGEWSLSEFDRTVMSPGQRAEFEQRAGKVLLWGSTPDGWVCGWAVTSPDPNLWGVVLVEIATGFMEYPDVHSFSSLLVAYASGAEVNFFLGREEMFRVPIWRGTEV